jgi:hypothetical protein
MGKPLADYVCHRINGFLNGGFHIREFTGMIDPETEMLVQPLEGKGQKINICALLS